MESQFIERIFSIKELENMINTIKKNNPIYNKKIPKQACGIFRIGDISTLEHRHIGNQIYTRVKF